MASITNVFTDTIGVTYKGNGSTVSATTGTYTGTRDAGVAGVVTAGATAQQFTVAFPVLAIQAMIIASSQDVTVNTNNATAGADVLIVSATAPVVWAVGYQHACPLTVDVTDVFVANATPTDAKFNIRVLLT